MNHAKRLTRGEWVQLTEEYLYELNTGAKYDVEPRKEEVLGEVRRLLDLQNLIEEK